MLILLRQGHCQGVLTAQELFFTCYFQSHLRFAPITPLALRPVGSILPTALYDTGQDLLMIIWSGGHGPVPLTNQEESVPTSKSNDLDLLVDTA